MWLLAANAEGIRARARCFDEQILRTFFHLCLGALFAPKYSLQPETGHYLVKAGWPVVLKKMCHWKEADTTICICCGARTLRSKRICTTSSTSEETVRGKECVT